MAENFKATDSSTFNLTPLPDCWIMLPGSGFKDDKIRLFALPEITDTKEAIYSDQTVQGRSSPVKTYSYSSNRTISLIMHLYVTQNSDIERNLKIIRAISALAHPEYNNTYLPPRVAKLKCGRLISDDPDGANVILRSYEVTYETEVQWFWQDAIEPEQLPPGVFGPPSPGKQGTYMPLHVSIPTQWDVVYDWQKLPGHQDVIEGRY